MVCRLTQLNAPSRIALAIRNEGSKQCKLQRQRQQYIANSVMRYIGLVLA
jgi:hypothetical protein